MSDQGKPRERCFELTARGPGSPPALPYYIMVVRAYTKEEALACARLPVGYRVVGELRWECNEFPVRSKAHAVGDFMIAVADIRATMLKFTALQRTDILHDIGICRDCGADIGDIRCQCMNDE